MAKPTVGFIGLGIMGKPMSGHLVSAGYDVVVHNRSRAAVAELVGQGAKETNSPKEVAEKSSVIITMLPDSPDVASVALGADGIIDGVSEGDIYIDMSTIAPSVTADIGEAMAKKGVSCLDAPVSGGDVGAKNATLSIMVGGKKRPSRQQSRFSRSWERTSCSADRWGLVRRSRPAIRSSSPSRSRESAKPWCWVRRRAWTPLKLSRS